MRILLRGKAFSPKLPQLLVRIIANRAVYTTLNNFENPGLFFVHDSTLPVTFTDRGAKFGFFVMPWDGGTTTGVEPCPHSPLKPRGRQTSGTSARRNSQKTQVGHIGFLIGW